ncbi:phage tail assembly chaperone G [Sutcliffiella horikoshii]|uniref:phage tail assembly chaperone G n=1 Tax=Sutcliffiella horikoshii TaxID=79883 RepID=UPI003CF5E069
MQIELYIGDEKKIFVAPFVPVSAKRKFLEIEARAEKREEAPSKQQQLEEDDEIMAILSDIVFKKQFTLKQLYDGASKEYVDQKLAEAVFGIKPKIKKEESEGNNQGE